jgi:hypothetical protein
VITARQAFEMNYNIHISEEFGFIFFNNPKAGCSTTKATLNLACAKRLGVDLTYNEMHDIHARERNVLKTPRQVGGKRFEAMVADPKVVRFCVLREPVARTCSAYASKFRGNSPQQQKLNTFLNRPLDYRWPDINEFVAVLASDNAIRDLDPHWRLQYRQVCAEDADLTMIGFQEELALSLQKFSLQVFGDADIALFDARAHFRQNVSRSGVQREALTPESLTLLSRAYAEDFTFYAREWARAHPGAPATRETTG